MPTVTSEVVIINPQGLHARPAAALVQTTLSFQCEIYMSLNGHRINAKSIMGVLTLAAAQGSRLEVECDGDDAEAATAAIRELVENGFGEMS